MSDDEIRKRVMDLIAWARQPLDEREVGRAGVQIAGLWLLHAINRDEREYEASPAAIERRAGVEPMGDAP